MGGIFKRRDYHRNTFARPIIFPQPWVHGFGNKGSARSVPIFTRMTLAHRVHRRRLPNAIAIPASLSDDDPAHVSKAPSLRRQRYHHQLRREAVHPRGGMCARTAAGVRSGQACMGERHTGECRRDCEHRAALPHGSAALSEDGRGCGGDDPRRNEVRITPDGPLYFRGELEIHTPTGMLKETRAAFCRCGASRNKPFCDNSHEGIAFRSSDESGMTATARGTEGGLLRVMPATNGPCIVEGSLTLISNGGLTRTACGPRVAFCRCGHSRKKPFCDRSHVKAGFRDIRATLSPRSQGVVVSQVAERTIAPSGRPKSS